jgi:hypothetical protein
MDKNEPQTWNVTENRFRTILILLRTAGVPININNGSVLRSIYNALMAINAYAMFIAICAEIIIHSDDLKNFMKTCRILNASSTVYWIHFNLRYITFISRNYIVTQWLRDYFKHKTQSQCKTAGASIIM